MPTVATDTKLPLDGHCVLLREKCVPGKTSDKMPEPPQDQQMEIMGEEAANLWGFREKPTVRTAVGEHDTNILCA